MVRRFSANPAKGSLSHCQSACAFLGPARTLGKARKRLLPSGCLGSKSPGEMSKAREQRKQHQMKAWRPLVRFRHLPGWEESHRGGTHNLWAARHGAQPGVLLGQAVPEEGVCVGVC